MDIQNCEVIYSVSKPQTIPQIIEEVKTEICDHYCKYPSEVHDPDYMIDTICEKCPLGRLG